MPLRRPLLGPALALVLPVVVFIPALRSDAAIVASGNLTPTYNSTDPWDVGGALTVGYNAPATLQIDGASVVNNTNGILAAFDSSTGEVTVNGAGSAWNNSGALLVGRVGNGTLNIENGGNVTNNAYGYLGLDETVTGTVHVTGTGSAWNNTGELHVGRLGTGVLNIENGAAVTNDGITYLGYAIGSTGNVTVTGTGSVWSANSDLYVGNIGNGTLNIQDGATVSTGGTSHIGLFSNSTGTVTVTGTCSVWDITGYLYVGHVGTGTGTLNILNGSVVNTQNNSSIGTSIESHGTVNIDNSRWDIIHNHLRVGYHGTGELNISNGGRVTNVEGQIGSQATGIGTAHVSGGSVWELSQALFVGWEGRGTLFIEDGGLIECAAGVLGHRAGSVGVATVTGAGSMWNCSFGIRVGQYTGQCTLLIENGGVVNAPDSVIGYESGLDNTVTVTGVGSAWNCSDLLTVGFRGQGTLTIEDAGIVSVSNQLTLGEEAGGIGVVNLAGGTLDLNGGQLAVGLGNATFNFTGGRLKDAGSIQLGEPFSQDGGTLAPGSSIGQTDIVGDYDLNAGTLEIELGGLGDPIDRVSVTGDIDIATLGTTLDLIALGPMAAGTYTLVESTAGTITGMFENVSPFNLFGVNVSVLNTGTAITVTLDGDLIFADPNLDGFVGIADLNIVLGNWNQSVTAGDISLGDLNGDGFVGIDDLNAVLGHWNAGTPPPPQALASVPEPGGVGFVLLGVVGACRWRRARSA